MTNGTAYEDRSSHERAIEETPRGLRELTPPDESLVDENPDVCYITSRYTGADEGVYPIAEDKLTPPPVTAFELLTEA